MRVFETIEAVEVFVNEAGTVSIRQECIDGSEPTIAIPPNLMPALIDALTAAAKEALEAE